MREQRATRAWVAETVSQRLAPGERLDLTHTPVSVQILKQGDRDPETGCWPGTLLIDFPPTNDQQAVSTMKRLSATFFVAGPYKLWKKAIRQALEARDAALLPVHSGDYLRAVFQEDAELRTLRDKLWQEAWETEDRKLQQLIKVIVDEGLLVGPGRYKLRTEEELREKARVRKRRADARVRNATQALQDTIDKAINMLPSATVRDLLRFRVARQKILEEVLKAALEDASPAIRAAAKQVQDRFARQWSAAGW